MWRPIVSALSRPRFVPQALAGFELPPCAFAHDRVFAVTGFGLSGIGDNASNNAVLQMRVLNHVRGASCRKGSTGAWLRGRRPHRPQRLDSIEVRRAVVSTGAFILPFGSAVLFGWHLTRAIQS